MLGLDCFNRSVCQFSTYLAAGGLGARGSTGSGRAQAPAVEVAGERVRVVDKPAPVPRIVDKPALVPKPASLGYKPMALLVQSLVFVFPI